MRDRSSRTRYAILAVITVGILRLSAGDLFSDARQEMDGSPDSFDSDLDNPFSIIQQVYGFPGAALPGIQNFSFMIPSVANLTPVPITAQVYLSNGFSNDSGGTPVLTSAVPVTGCTITVPAGYNNQWPPPTAQNPNPSQTCNVNSTDAAAMVTKGIMNPLVSTQNIGLGLGSEAKYLVFSSSSGNSSTVSMHITPGPTPPLIFVMASGGGAPPQQPYTLPKFLGTISSPTIPAGCGTWLTAGLSSTTYPSTLTLSVNPAGLSTGIYQSCVTVTSGSGSLTLPVILNVLPASPQYLQQSAKLVAPSGQGSSQLGVAVSLSQNGNAALVGAPADTGGTNYGQGWLYNRTAGLWNTTPTGLSYSSLGQAQEGTAVAMSSDGSVTLVGGRADDSNLGAAWVSGGPCTPSKLVGIGGTGGAEQGAAVALSGDGLTALVGGYFNNSGVGAAWVWVCSAGSWTQQVLLVGAGAVGSAEQGSAVALSSDGNTALVGGPGDNSSAGAVWVFTRSGTSWTQQGPKLVGSGAVGAAYQGLAVALSADGNTAMVGGYLDNTSVGAAWIFTRSGSAWSQQVKLVGSGSVGTLIYQANTVSLSADGNTAASGSRYDNNHVGAAWIFKRSGGSWTQFGSKLFGSGAVTPSEQGRVALSGDGGTVLLGGWEDNSFVGAAWPFALSGPPPALSSLNPTQTLAGAGFTLTVNGSNFLNGATVQWNGTPLATTFVSSSQLTATVPVSLLLVPATVPIVVANADGTPTGALTFTVNAPMLTVVSSHSGNFAQGESNAPYTLTVANAPGAVSTSGQVTVAETVPSGMTLASLGGAGWSCNVGTATCTRSDVLPGGSSYTAITSKVNVAGGAGSPLVNQASVYGGQAAYSAAFDSTTVITPSACDVNIDASVNIADVQLMVNEILNVVTPTHDLNHDGKVNVVDAQIVVNAALGFACTAH